MSENINNARVEESSGGPNPEADKWKSLRELADEADKPPEWPDNAINGTELPGSASGSASGEEVGGVKVSDGDGLPGPEEIYAESIARNEQAEQHTPANGRSDEELARIFKDREYF